MNWNSIGLASYTNNDTIDGSWFVEGTELGLHKTVDSWEGNDGCASYFHQDASRIVGR